MQDPGAVDSANGDRYYNRKQYTEAIRHYSTAVKKNPINPEHHFHLGNAFDCTLQHDLAIEAYTQCITLNGQNARYRYQRGVTWYFLGKFREALEDFEQALKLDPNHSEASRGCGLACKGIGAYSNALGYFRRALKVDPNNMMVYLSYAYTLKVVGQFPKMLQVFLDVVEIASFKIAGTGQNSLSFDWLYGRQEAFKCLGLFDLAVSDCDWIVSICDQTGKDYRATFQNRAVALFKLGRLQEALRDINRAIQEGTMEDPDYPLVIRGDIYKALQHYPQALKDYTKALSLARHANTCAKIAQIYWILNDVNSALKYLDQAFAINENSKSALSYKATIVYSLGQYEAAAHLYQKILSIDPNNFEARDRLTRIMNETTPLQPIKIVITPYERLVRGCCIGHLGKIRRLIEHFKIEIDPKTPMLYSRGNVLNMRTKELMNVLNRLNINLEGLTTREQLENATIGLPCVVLTPVVAAVLHGQVNVFKYLIDHDADLNRGVLMTPLMAAVHVVSQFGSKMIEDLLLNGANVNLLFKGTTALHLAASLNLDETCDLLLKYGADATILDENSKLASEVTTSALVQKVISKYLNNPVLDSEDLSKLSEKAENETTETNTYRRVCLQRTLMSMNKKEKRSVPLRKKEDAVEFYDVSQRFTRHCAKTYFENIQVDSIQKIVDSEYESNHWHQKAKMNFPTPNYETQYMFLHHKENFGNVLENFTLTDFDERARATSPDRLRDLIHSNIQVIVVKVCFGKSITIPFGEKIPTIPEGHDSVIAQSISSDGTGNLRSIHVSNKFQIIPLFQISCRIVGRIVQQIPPQTPIMQDADTVASCRSCTKTFSILRKKHHCHMCGFVFCNECAGKKVELPNFGYVQAVRVCYDCFEKVSSPPQYKRV